MKLSKFTDEEMVALEVKSTDKEGVITELVDLVRKASQVKDADELHNAIIEREKLVTTGVGYGVAFPHAKSKAVKGIVIAFGRSTDGIEFEAMDKKPVHLFFLIGAPEDAIGAHLNVMARLSYLMKNEDNRAKLLRMRHARELLDLIDSVD